MAYNPLKDQSAGYISKEHYELLNKLKIAQKRTKRGVLEQLIEDAAGKLKS